MEYSLIDKKCVLRIENTIYSLDVIHKALYWYTGDFAVDIRQGDLSIWEVTLTSKSGDEVDFEFIADRIRQSLIDFHLRDIVNKETQTIRELIVAKAFANFEMEASVPETAVSDPVGFNPMAI